MFPTTFTTFKIASIDYTKYLNFFFIVEKVQNGGTTDALIRLL